MNWLKRLFGKRKSAAEQENTPTAPATDSAPAPAEKPAPTTESALEAATETAAPEAATAETPDTAAPEAAAPEAAAESTSEPPAAESEPAADPAMSVLDDVERAAELQTATPEAAEGPYGPASAKPASDGAPPSAEFTIKGKESSKLFHTEESPYFGRTKADVWFKSAADAESAGFTAYTRKKATAKK